LNSSLNLYITGIKNCFEQFPFDYTELIDLIVKNFPETSMELIISQTKKSFCDHQYLRGSIILRLTNHFKTKNHFKEKIFERLIDEGIFEILLNSLRFESTHLIFIILQIYSIFSCELMESNMMDELKIIVKEFMKFFRTSPIYFKKKILYFLAIFIKKTSKGRKILDLSEIDFNELIEFMIENVDASFFHFSATFIRFGKIDSNLVKFLDKSLEILNNEGGQWKIFFNSPNSFFSEIVRHLKFNFKPWINETIKLCLKGLNEILEDPEECNLEVFTLLASVISTFQGECEIYISKYKIVRLMVQFLCRFVKKILNFNQKELSQGEKPCHYNSSFS
jgi:hypothetical protein